MVWLEHSVPIQTSTLFSWSAVECWTLQFELQELLLVKIIVGSGGIPWRCSSP